MFTLAVSSDVVEACCQLREFAEDPHHWRRDGERAFIPGDLEPYSVLIPVGFKAVYSIDYVDGKASRHLSVSLTRPDGSPAVVPRPAMMQLAELFGFGEGAVMGTLPTDPPWVIHAIEAFDPS